MQYNNNKKKLKKWKKKTPHTEKAPGLHLEEKVTFAFKNSAHLIEIHEVKMSWSRL